MTFLDYKVDLEKAFKKYQKKAKKYGVASDLWCISEITDNTIKIIIPSVNREVPTLTVSTISNSKHPFCIMYEDDVNYPFDMLSDSVVGYETYKNIVVAMDNCFEWIMSNIL